MDNGCFSPTHDFGLQILTLGIFHSGWIDKVRQTHRIAKDLQSYRINFILRLHWIPKLPTDINHWSSSGIQRIQEVHGTRKAL